MLKLSILLSTYNGQKYVRQQIESILCQNFRDFQLIIRDDGSSDDTVSIIKSFCDPRVILVEDVFGNLGPTGSFVELLKRVESDIYMFCDQDDIWLEDKVELVHKKFQDIYRDNVFEPILMHSDLLLVDDKLNSMGLTFNQHENVKLPNDYSLGKLLVQNCVVGCTVAVNKALVERSKICFVDPKRLAMHDWWLALAASRFGKIFCLESVSILYRQHGGNVSGLSQKGRTFRRIKSIFNGNGLNRVEKYCQRISKQSAEFLGAFRSQLSDSEVQKIYLLISGYSISSVFSLIKCFLLGIRFGKFYMNFAVLLCYFVSNRGRHES